MYLIYNFQIWKKDFYKDQFFIDLEGKSARSRGLRKIFIIPVLVISIIAISFSIQYASSSSILELIGSDPFFSQDCKALDNTATVSPSTKTCDVHNVTINDGQTLQIGNGVTLMVENSFTNNGNVRVSGNIVLNTDSLMTNNGRLELRNDASLTINGGSINLGGNGLLDINNGIFNLNGGTMTMSGNAKETIRGNSLITQSGNTQETISGDNTITKSGNAKETVNGNKNIVITGQRTETVDGKEFITIHGDRTETVSGKETITIHGSRTETVDGNEKITITGQRTKTVDHDETITIHHDRTETVDGNEKITIHGSRTETVDHDETITIHGTRTETVDGKEKITIGGHKTETVSSGGTLTIGGHSKETIISGTTITVAKGGTVIVDKGVTLSNEGVIDIIGMMTNDGKIKNFNSIIADCGGIFSGNQPTGNPITVQCLGPPQATILASPSPAMIGTSETLSSSITDPGCPACTPSSFSYAWTLSSPPGSSSVLSSPSVPSPSFTPDLPGNYQVSLVVTDTLGQSSAQTFLTLSASSCGTCVPTVFPTVLTNPSLTLGIPVTLAANPGDAGCPACISSFTYHWSLIGPPSSTSVLSNPTLQDPTFIPDVAGSYQLSVIATDSSGQSSAPGIVTLTAVQPPVTPTIAAPNLLTSGKSYTASLSARSGMTYLWTIIDGTITSLGGNAGTLSSDGTTNSISFTADLPGLLTIASVEINAAGDTSAPGSAPATVFAAPIAPTITVSNSVNSGQSYLASVTARSGMTYLWTLTDGTITSPGGSAGITAGGTNSISFTAGTPGTLIVSATETNAAGDSASSTSSLVVN